MERRYKVTHSSGVVFDVVEVRADATMDAQISVMGDKGFIKKPFSEFRDLELESQGWYRLAWCNGSLFMTENGETFACGIEKAYGVVHENDDAAWDNTMGFYHNNGVPYMYKQSYIKSIINRSDVRGAKTAAFGLVNNGLIDISGAKEGEPSRKIYLQKSGRTIVGKRADNTIVMATCDGVTGVSGLTGYQTAIFARDVLKLRNAVCEDGGGSTALGYKDTIINGTSRDLVNCSAIYIKYKNPLQVGDRVIINGVFTIENIIGDKATLKELSAAVYYNKLQKVE